MDLYSYARKYYEKWKISPIPIIYNRNDNMQPLIKLSPIYEKEELIFIEDEKIWRRAKGIAIIPRENHVAIDIDKVEYPEAEMESLYKAGLIIIETRRGFHAHAEIDKKIGEIRIYRFGEKVGEGGGSLFNHPWTVPPTIRGDFQYKFYKYNDKDIPELPRLKWEEFKDLVELILQAEIEEITSKKLKGKDIAISSFQIKDINNLLVDQLKILLFLIFHDMGCRGLRDLMYEWIKMGTVQMRKFGWGNRTSRFYFLHTITAILALMGVPHKKIAEILESYEDLDGKPNDAHHSALWTVFEWKQPLFRRLYVMKRGECFFCSIRGYRNCQKNPVLRFYYYLQSRGKEKVEELVGKLLSNERS